MACYFLSLCGSTCFAVLSFLVPGGCRSCCGGLCCRDSCWWAGERHLFYCPRRRETINAFLALANPPPVSPLQKLGNCSPARQFIYNGNINRVFKTRRWGGCHKQYLHIFVWARRWGGLEGWRRVLRAEGETLCDTSHLSVVGGVMKLKVFRKRKSHARTHTHRAEDSL